MKYLLILAFSLFVFAPKSDADCQPVTQDGKQKVICTAMTGLLSSGKGKDTSDWYNITSTLDHPESGKYTVESASFRLEGPHPCTGDISSSRRCNFLLRSLRQITDIRNRVSGSGRPTHKNG
jgi:hypothetical protein